LIHHVLVVVVSRLNPWGRHASTAKTSKSTAAKTAPASAATWRCAGGGRGIGLRLGDKLHGGDGDSNIDEYEDRFLYHNNFPFQTDICHTASVNLCRCCLADIVSILEFVHPTKLNGGLDVNCNMARLGPGRSSVIPNCSIMFR
jgi:hypothetical protein